MKISRIAPTPSGLLHRGNAFNFLYTLSVLAAAGEEGSALRLRIDDLDAPRVRPEYLQDIFDTLMWLGISWATGPKDVADHVAHFKQAYRISQYDELLNKLVSQRRVFACTCSRKDILLNNLDGQYPGTCRFKNIPLNTPDASWRLFIQKNTIIHFKDVLLGEVSIDLSLQARDFVIRRRDGIPAYHIASLADDHRYSINTIVRGEDLLLSTAVQLYLADCLGLEAFKQVAFYHHPLIKDISGDKLSKSAGSTAIKSLREQGMNRELFLQEFQQWRSSFNSTR